MPSDPTAPADNLDDTHPADRPYAGKYRRDLKPEIVKSTDTHRWYRCQFLDCPRPKSLMKIEIQGRAGRGPTYHPDCKARLKVIRTTRDGTPDGMPLFDDEGRDVVLQPATPADRVRLNMEICGRTRLGRVKGECCMPAGWGTAHAGIGACKLHGGSSPSGNVHAAKAIMIRDSEILGAPIVIGPHEAVLQEIHRTAGHVEWLRMMISVMGIDPTSTIASEAEDETGIATKGIQKTLSQFTEKGMQPSVWIDMYQKERTHLVQTCKMAVQMGCAERSIELAEGQGRMIAAVMSKVFNNPALALTNVQKAALGPIVRQELMALSPESQSTIQERTA